MKIQINKSPLKIWNAALSENSNASKKIWNVVSENSNTSEKAISNTIQNM